MRKNATPTSSQWHSGFNSQCRAFTLIELLVVITILGILMSIIISGMSGAIDSAKKVQAKNDVTQIATAIVAYETEYGRLPTTSATDGPVLAAGANPSTDTDIITILANLKTGNTNNPRAITFLEVPTAKKGKSGITNYVFVDPWGGTYQIYLDGDYDNTLTYSVPSLSAGGTESVTVRKRAIVWNTNDATGSLYRKRVRSWE